VPPLGGVALGVASTVTVTSLANAPAGIETPTPFVISTSPPAGPTTADAPWVTGDPPPVDSLEHPDSTPATVAAAKARVNVTLATRRRFMRAPMATFRSRE